MKKETEILIARVIVAIFLLTFVIRGIQITSCASGSGFAEGSWSMCANYFGSR